MSGSPATDRILSILSERGPMTGREVAAAMPEFKGYFVREVLWEMILGQRLTLTKDLKLAVSRDCCSAGPSHPPDHRS